MAIPTAFSGPKLESLSSSAAAASPASIGLFCNPGRVRRLSIQKGLFNSGIRCEVAASDVVDQSQSSGNVTSSSSLSALEQLKSSAADSMCFICVKFFLFTLIYDYFENLDYILQLIVFSFLLCNCWLIDFYFSY